MKSYTIMLKSIKDVQNFCYQCSGFDIDIDVVRGRYVIDAKSIMGLFSLDLSKPLEVHIDTRGLDETTIKAFSGVMAAYAV